MRSSGAARALYVLTNTRAMPRGEATTFTSVGRQWSTRPPNGPGSAGRRSSAATPRCAATSSRRPTSSARRPRSCCSCRRSRRAAGSRSTAPSSCDRRPAHQRRGHGVRGRPDVRVHVARPGLVGRETGGGRAAAMVPACSGSARRVRRLSSDRSRPPLAGTVVIPEAETDRGPPHRHGGAARCRGARPVGRGPLRVELRGDPGRLGAAAARPARGRPAAPDPRRLRVVYSGERGTARGPCGMPGCPSPSGHPSGRRTSSSPACDPGSSPMASRSSPRPGSSRMPSPSTRGRR